MDEKRAATSTANKLVRRLHGEGGTAVAVVFFLAAVAAPGSVFIFFNLPAFLPIAPLSFFPSFASPNSCSTSSGTTSSKPNRSSSQTSSTTSRRRPNRGKKIRQQASQQVEEDQTEVGRLDKKLHNK